MNTVPAAIARVLIVDRNEDLLELFSFFLESRGFNVRTAPSGTLALTCAAEFAPHAVFASLRVGELDGYMLAKELRKLPQTENSTLVAMSAYATKVWKRTRLDSITI
jgi:CheY-like chemotaxis protein